MPRQVKDKEKVAELGRGRLRTDWPSIADGKWWHLGPDETSARSTRVSAYTYGKLHGYTVSTRTDGEGGLYVRFVKRRG